MIFRIAAVVAWFTALFGLGIILVLAALRDAGLTHLATLLIGIGLVARLSIARAESQR